MAGPARASEAGELAGDAELLGGEPRQRGLTTSIAVITDGQISGRVNGGLLIAEASPEGAADGPIDLVRDGDIIGIDANARTIDPDVDQPEPDRHLLELHKGNLTRWRQPQDRDHLPHRVAGAVGDRLIRAAEPQDLDQFLEDDPYHRLPVEGSWNSPLTLSPGGLMQAEQGVG
jgi:hypothetical protein